MIHWIIPQNYMVSAQNISNVHSQFSAALHLGPKREKGKKSPPPWEFYLSLFEILIQLCHALCPSNRTSASLYTRPLGSSNIPAAPAKSDESLMGCGQVQFGSPPPYLSVSLSLSLACCLYALLCTNIGIFWPSLGLSCKCTYPPRSMRY